MDLRMARLCLDCEEVFEVKARCPRCGSGSWLPIMGWIRPIREVERRFVLWKDVLILAERGKSEGLDGTALEQVRQT